VKIEVWRVESGERRRHRGEQRRRDSREITGGREEWKGEG